MILKIKEADLTAPELAKMFGRHRATITKWARMLGVKLPQDKSTKYTHDRKFFRCWSNDMAYVLGFIAADGCVMTNPRGGRIIEITLSKKDKKHLCNLRTLMKTNVEIKNKDNAVRLSICNQHLGNDLISLGIMPRKSTCLKWIDVPDGYVSHFVRGYFDGDGTIFESWSKRFGHKYRVLRIGILGTDDLLQGIKRTFTKHYGKEVGGIHKQVFNAYRWEITTRSAVEFCNWIYKDTSERNRLERKYNVFKNYMEVYKNADVSSFS